MHPANLCWFAEHCIAVGVPTACLTLCHRGPLLQLTFIDVATLFGILCGYISTFLAWSYTRAGRKLALLQVQLRAASAPGGA